MNIKPTAEAIKIARTTGTLDRLLSLAQARTQIASRHGLPGKNASKHIAAQARKACSIPAGVPIFEVHQK